MSLDAAEFIAELSVTDPPGTDPLNQGDDHIRTTKRAVQQSFPNVGSAVPQTGAQMAQMAIKNEVNTFTQTNLFDARQDTTGNFRFLFGAGATRGPQWQDQDTGFKIWDLVANAATQTLSLRRFVGGVQQSQNPISFDATNGFVTFDTAAAAFFGQALRLETGLTPSTAVQTGALFIGGSGTLRWSISRQADDVTGDLVINRHNSAGTLQNTPFRIQQSTGDFDMDTNRLSLTRPDSGEEVILEFRNDSGVVRWSILFASSGRLHIQSHDGAGAVQRTPIELSLTAGGVFMNELPTGATANSKEIYAKQSQLFAGTELVLGQTP